MPHSDIKAKYGKHARHPETVRKAVGLMLPGQTKLGVRQDFAMKNKHKVKTLKSFAAMTPKQRKRTDIRGVDDGTRRLGKIYGHRHAFPDYETSAQLHGDAPPPLRKRAAAPAAAPKAKRQRKVADKLSVSSRYTATGARSRKAPNRLGH